VGAGANYSKKMTGHEYFNLRRNFHDIKNRLVPIFPFGRRKHARRIVEDCSVRCASKKWICPGKVLDISEGGVKVDMEVRPEITQNIELFMTDESGLQLKKKAVVVWYIRKSPPETGAIASLKYI